MNLNKIDRVLSKRSGIYKIYCEGNGKFYIGSSNDLYDRLNKHRKFLNKKNHFNIILQRIFNKYGHENLFVFILEYCNPKELKEREQYYLDSLKPEINICKQANSKLGVKHSEATKKIISDKCKSYKLTPEQSEKRRVSAIINNANPEKRKRCSLRMTGNKYALGYTHSEETKMFISKNNTGRKLTEHQKEKLSIAKLGKPTAQTKTILQYDLRGNLINKFKSLTEAKNKTGLSMGAICNNCNNKSKTSNGFRFRYIS